MIIGSDLEWSRQAVDVLGLAWDGGLRNAATARNPDSLAQYIDTLNHADTVVGHSFIDADCRQLAKEGVDITGFEHKVFDTRLAIHTTHGHLAGSGSFDLRSMVLLLNGRQGIRFPLDFKAYESDIYRTCAMDASAALWCYPTLDRLVKQGKLEGTLKIAHDCAPIFARMRDQGVRLDKDILNQIYLTRKAKTEEIVEKYHLWEERGKKVIKKVPIWRSDKILDVCQSSFGIRPKDRQRKTWDKLAKDPSLSPDAKDFIDAVIDLGRGANDAHWLGQASASDTGDGFDFTKVTADGFIHPRYDICGSPDRAIASGPNIQNFPRPNDDPRPVKLRSAVVALDESHTVLGIDFSSLETLTNAIESDDWDRVQATLDGRISHEGTASIINNAFKLSLNRQQGKAINHGFDKGESPHNLARTLFKTERPSRQQNLQCQQIVGQMLKEYPKTAKFRDDLWERSRDNPLVVTNSFGRRLLCFSRAKYGDAGEWFAKHDASKKYWCSCGECAPRRDRWKYAIAFLGRSAGFDALLRKMSQIYYDKRLDNYSLPIVECHDELLYSVARGTEQRYGAILKECFESEIPELGGIKLPSNVAIGDSWATAH